MKKPTSLLPWIIALAGIAVAVGLGGCRNPFFRPSPPTPQSKPATPQQESAAAKQVVVDYVTALQKGDYSGAYGMLSADSQAHHAPASFEQQGKQGMPLYDLTKATATVNGDAARVEVPLSEDAATHGFQLVREGGVWKIVYRGGIPGAPYPD